MQLSEPSLKRMAAYRFAADVNVKQGVSWIQALETDFFHAGIHVLVPRWEDP
jgi:hypothetical protein